MSGARTLRNLATLLSKTLGDTKASHVVAQHAQELGLVDPLSREQALTLLERIAQTPGIVGITARFAKTRLYLADRAD